MTAYHLEPERYRKAAAARYWGNREAILANRRERYRLVQLVERRGIRVSRGTTLEDLREAAGYLANDRGV